MTDVLSEPAPRLSGDAVRALLAELWGMRAQALAPLPSERDLNLMVDRRWVLKVANPAEASANIDMELAAMAHLEQVAPDLPVPRTVPTRRGMPSAPVTDAAGRACVARVVTALPGEQAEGQPIGEDLAEQVGSVTARTSRALGGFFHPAAGGRGLDWDMRRLEVVARRAVASGHLHAAEPLAEVVGRVQPALRATRALPGGVQHADVTLTNLIVDDGRITGVIDLGDMHHTADVCDLAVALTSVLRNTAQEQPVGTWELAGAVLRGYQRHRWLSPEEVEVLGELVLARLALGTLISRTRAAVHVDNTDYITQHDATSARLLEDLAASTPEDLAARLHRLAGTSHAGTGASGAAAAAGNTTVPGSTVAPPSTTALRARRDAVMGGPVAPLFYRDPVQVVAGEGPWLHGADGRRYLDAYNNVAVVGHTDPTVTGRVARQLARLNTHSRYLHPEVVELAERLVATMPEGLDTVLFTTSGTEANELAWRIATEVTGGDGALVVEHAYHGSTGWMADLSSSEWPPGHRPARVGTYRAPHHHGVDPGDLGTGAAGERVAQGAAYLRKNGHRPALLLADSGFTSEGVHDAPAGYLQGLVDGAHREGALYLADEVQVGYGRTGPGLWCFTRAGITPDLVSLGKPMGAGYPIGALVTRRELADRLAERYEYFSTFAATPAAAAAGNAVLDVLADRRLPERALMVGGYLAGRLRELAADSPVLGEVRAVGLVAGVDVLAGPAGSAGDARAVAQELVERLVRRGVLAGLTGPGGDVLKVRPPLVWGREHVDLFVDRLAGALEGLG